MNSDRIDELLKQTAYPESNSVRQAMLQVWNEMQQDFNGRTCGNCKHLMWDSCAYHNAVKADLGFVPEKFSCFVWEKKQ